LWRAPTGRPWGLPADDNAATIAAKQYSNGQDIELWCRGRRVTRLYSPDGSAEPKALAIILPFLRPSDGAFDDGLTRITGDAFDAACEQLGESGFAARESVAGRIIAAVKKDVGAPTRCWDLPDLPTKALR
jgi:hypothetical protein